MTLAPNTVETIDIPQADRIWDVARVPEAVSQGAVTPAAIAAHLGDKVPRQGLYYAQAAQLLGLVTRDEFTGRYALTAYGRAFTQYDRDAKRAALRRLVLQHPPLRQVADELAVSNGRTRAALIAIVQEMTGLAESTARRRVQTIALWLVTLGLAAWRDGRLALLAAPARPVDVRRN